MTTPGQFSTRQPGNGSRIKMALAWVSVGFGFLILITSPTYGGFAGFFAAILIGLAITIPGAWFLLHERRDRSNPSSALNRHWKIVTPVSILFFVLGLILFPPTEEAKQPDNKPAATTSSSSTPTESSTRKSTTTTSASSTTRKTTKSSTKSSSKSSSTKTSTTSGSHVPEKYVDEPSPILPSEPAEQQQHIEPAPAETPAPAPAPAPAEAPAPAPAPSAFYPNCAAARAAGAAPLYRGNPGYSTKLDRDGDGVACE